METLKRKQKTVRYITDAEVHKMTLAIYNDNRERLMKLVHDSVGRFENISFRKEIADRKAAKEGYVQLQSPLEHVILTRDGRLINTEFGREFALHMTNGDLTLYVKGIKVSFRMIFEQMGWDFNKEEIYRNLLERESVVNDQTTPSGIYDVKKTVPGEILAEKDSWFQKK